MQLQNGTVWRWNRPLVGFEDNGRPHLRHETRGIPAGPTFIDSLATAAFLIGLVFYMLRQDWDREPLLSFEDARENFYAAARDGLNAQFSWPDKEKISASKLIARDLLSAAREGLRHAEVASSEADLFLGVIAARVESGQTGAAWQRCSFAEHGRDSFRLMAAYCENQRSGRPVHEWPI